MTYTKETLLPLNAEYLSEHRLTDGDVETVNATLARIEARREGAPVPQDGDTVICQRADGSIRTSAGHLEQTSWTGDPKMSLCLDLYSAPFLKSALTCSASGGPWDAVDPAALTFVERRSKRFNIWGHMGPCRSGAISFEASVNVWHIILP